MKESYLSFFRENRRENKIIQCENDGARVDTSEHSALLNLEDVNSIYL